MMPKEKKRNALSQTEQSERFVATVRELGAAGTPNTTEAGKRFSRKMGKPRDEAQADKEMQVDPSSIRMSQKPSHRLKFERAQHHLHQLKSEVAKWRETCGYATRWEPDANDPKYSVVVASFESFPSEELFAIVGDVIQDLRASLDHLVYALSWAYSGPLSETQARACQFTILGERDEITGTKSFDNTGGKGLKCVSPEARAIIEELQPYNFVREFPELGTNIRDSLLWQLNELGKWERHRIVHVSAAFTGGFEIAAKPGCTYPKSTDVAARVELFRGFVMKRGTEIARLPVLATDGEMNMNVETTLDVAFFDAEPPLFGKVVIDVLSDISFFLARFVFPPLEDLM